MCPAGCGRSESRIHFIQCTARHLQAGHIKRREEFRQVHKKLRTAKVIYEGFMRILSALRCGDSPPSKVTHFESELDDKVQMAWKEQRKIGWNQILKEKLSKQWGEAMGMFYKNSPETRGKLCFWVSCGRQLR